MAIMNESDGDEGQRSPADRSEARRQRRLALLLAMEIRRIIEDLLFRKGLLLEVWSRMRARAPLLRILRSRYDGIPASELLLLPGSILLPMDRFYRHLDEFRLYLETTEDMPRSLEGQYEIYSRELENLGVVVLAGLRPIHGENIGGSGEGVQGGEILDDEALPPLAALTPGDEFGGDPWAVLESDMEPPLDDEEESGEEDPEGADSEEVEPEPEAEEAESEMPESKQSDSKS